MVRHTNMRLSVLPERSIFDTHHRRQIGVPLSIGKEDKAQTIPTSIVRSKSPVTITSHGLYQVRAAPGLTQISGLPS